MHAVDPYNHCDIAYWDPANTHFCPLVKAFLLQPEPPHRTRGGAGNRASYMRQFASQMTVG